MAMVTAAGNAVVSVPKSGAREVLARELWDEHYARLAGWVASLVGDIDVAHDIASEAFVRLLTRWLSVRDPRGFLYVTATNLVRDCWRAQKRERRLAIRLEDRGPGTFAAPDPWLRDLVERLPERLREPVLLYYFADFSVDEVAAALHRPSGTIKRCLSDARAQLHGWIGDDA
ncbi:MAG: hypothetical protein QOE01_2957 [Actinomycetota bacterium]|jgi:RNA polymerase sigma-70 factor (ECF subfamily)|nr:hypothetical protein [Actinomycetota bacterium]